jgi:hypothetical protein
MRSNSDTQQTHVFAVRFLLCARQSIFLAFKYFSISSKSIASKKIS